MRWGDHLEFVAEAGPGDFIYVLPFSPHQGINASQNETLSCVLVRSDQEPIVVNLDIEPAEAARDFLMGHLNVEIAILFDEIDWELSAGAKEAVEAAKESIFQTDWRKVFDHDNLLASTRAITEEK